MQNYGTKKYAFIPANDNLFDFSLKLTKFVLFRYLSNWRFNNQKNKQINDTERAKSFGHNNYDIILNCKYNGYKVLIYSSKQNPCSNKKLISRFGFLVKLGLVEEIIENIDVDNFDNLILKYNISTVNSIFIADDTETWHKLYNRFNPDNANKISNVNRHEFAIKYWNNGGDHYIYPNLINNSHTHLYSLFFQQFRPSRLIFSLQSTDFVQNQVIYIGAKNDEKITAYIDQNYELIKKKLAEKDLTFIYFPKLKDDIDELLKIIKPAFNYIFPQFNNQDFTFIKSFLESMTAKEYYNFIIDALQLPDFSKPSLLKNMHNIYEGEENLFYSFPLDENIGNDLMPYIDRTVKANTTPKGEAWFQKPKVVLKYNADDSFEWEATKISNEIKAKIDLLIVNGKHKALAEMVVHICSNLKDIKPELYEQIKSLNIADNKTKLSPLIIDTNFRIFLPDYGNIEIEMSPLPKTLYLFFLKHPNGIMLHDLVDHKKELLAIYNKITNSSEPTEIIKRIDDMVDMTNNSINEKCSRIKEAFVSKIDDSLAQYYYVNGKRGAPKKVLIPTNLVVFK
jgi:hypothetical protein